MAIQRACTVCGALSANSRCPQHPPKRWSAGIRTQRSTLSGWAQQRRARYVIERDNGICHVCGYAGADQADHVHPIAEGGADDISNMKAIHAIPCHRDKSQREASRARHTP